MSLTVAEKRAYQQLCGADGFMLVIAADQRGGIRKLLANEAAEQAAITDAQLGDVKASIVANLAVDAPCILLDPICALPRVVEDGTLPRDVALLVGIDASGHGTDPDGHYLARLVPGINARKVRDLGGAAGKVLVYLRSDYPDASAPNLALLKKTIADFAAENVLLITEFLPYRLPSEDAEAYAAKLAGIIEGDARMCLEAGAKVLKMPFPGSADGCRKITAMCGDVPWTVLSAGVDHVTFLGQVKIAMANGCAGVIGGRALWKDCVSLDAADCAKALRQRGRPRLAEIKAVLKATKRAA